MIRFRELFPDGHSCGKDIKMELKGIIIKDLKGREARLKGFTEEDIRDIRMILIEEIRRQKDAEQTLS